MSFAEAKLMVSFPGQKKILDSIFENFVSKPPLELLLIKTM